MLLTRAIRLMKERVVGKHEGELKRSQWQVTFFIGQFQVCIFSGSYLIGRSRFLLKRKIQKCSLAVIVDRESNRAEAESKNSHHWLDFLLCFYCFRERRFFLNLLRGHHFLIHTNN